MFKIESCLDQIPKEKGNYILVFTMPTLQKIKVGALEYCVFPPGQYYYAGSALGPGGLRARIRHHLKASPNPHWHLDYLKPFLQWSAVGWYITNQRLECAWAQSIAGMMEATIPVIGFGSSDCQAGCKAHLIQSNFPFHKAARLIGPNDLIEFKYNKADFDK